MVPYAPQYLIEDPWVIEGQEAHDDRQSRCHCHGRPSPWRIYRGEFFLYSPNRESLALVEFAREMIREAFGGRDPETAQFDIPVEAFATLLADLKPRFIHHPESKRLIRDLLLALGCDSSETYFDVPRLRTSTSDDYLTTGIAYAFHPHRDTWYSAPFCQINWWLPVYPITSDNAMAFHPNYWQRSVLNSSERYDYAEWNRTSRKDAAKHIGTDTREQPKPLEPLELQPDLRLLPPPGGTICSRPPSCIRRCRTRAGERGSASISEPSTCRTSGR